MAQYTNSQQSCRSSSPPSPPSSRTYRRTYHLQPGDVGAVKPGDRLEGSIEV